MRDNAFLIATGFAGAGFGLLVAEYMFGATGVGKPLMIAFIGYVLSFGFHIWNRKKMVDGKNG